jgi:hypothetical protein
MHGIFVYLGLLVKFVKLESLSANPCFWVTLASVELRQAMDALACTA